MARGSADESTGVAAADAALEWLNPGVGGWSARLRWEKRLVRPRRRLKDPAASAATRKTRRSGDAGGMETAVVISMSGAGKGRSSRVRTGTPISDVSCRAVVGDWQETETELKTYILLPRSGVRWPEWPCAPARALAWHESWRPRRAAFPGQQIWH